MKRAAMTYGLPFLIALGVAGYYLWPVPPNWTVFEVPADAGAQNVWIAEGFKTQEECDTYIGLIIGSPGVPEGTRLVCGFDCRSLRSAPQFELCEMMGDLHDKG